MLSTEKREAIIAYVASQMSQKRFEHTLRVEQMAVYLAEKYAVDVTLCQYAALLHDVAKEWTMAQYEQVVGMFKLNPELMQFGSEICHGPVGAMATLEWYDHHESVKQAIMQHTIGAVEMDAVAKVLFVADYIEVGRTFDGVEQARLLAEKSLDLAIRYKLKQTITFLAKKGTVIYPETVHAYNSWVNKKLGEDDWKKVKKY